MSGPMGEKSKVQFPIKVQYKNDVLTNLRCVNTHDLKKDESPYFKNALEFLQAVQETIDMYEKSDPKHTNGQWLEKVAKKYKSLTSDEIY